LVVVVQQNPDSPAEMQRIVRAGGFVSPPPEPGLSARVWLDPDFTQVRLRMRKMMMMSLRMRMRIWRMMMMMTMMMVMIDYEEEEEDHGCHVVPIWRHLPVGPGRSSRLPCRAHQPQVGLAMARSIGDHAVKGVGVIAEPEVMEHEFTVRTNIRH
jgi:hypothetical protein